MLPVGIFSPYQRGWSCSTSFLPFSLDSPTQVTQLRIRTSGDGNLNGGVNPGSGGDGLSGKEIDSVDEQDESKSALDVLADDTASEEIFGKAFRGGRAAAAGLMARLQREV